MSRLLFFLFGAMITSFVCSILESVLMSTPISYITMREEEGYKPAKKFKQYKQDSSRPIAAILSLNTIANTLGAAGVGSEVTRIFGSEWLGLASAITTVLILIFSEIIPKTIGTSSWKHLMGVTTSAIRVIIIILFPLVWLVEWFSKAIAPKNEEAAVSREEVLAMANVAEEEEVLDEDENTAIQNIIRIDDIPAYEAMTPRIVAATAPEKMTLKAFYHSRKYLHHSRIPVYSDNDAYITGYILRSDVLQLVADDKFDLTLGSIKRDIELFNEEKPLGEIWDVMIAKKEQICCIIDDYGAFLGILTLEDIIETIFGNEIVDENDAVTDMQQYARDRYKSYSKTKSSK